MRIVVGLILIAIALMKIAELWGIVHLEWLWRQSWTDYFIPVLMLYFGVELIIYSYSSNPSQWLQRPLPIGEEGKRICCSVRYGGDEYIYRGETFRGAHLNVFCGGIRLDLREAVIPEDEEIDIHTFLGGVELFVPEGIKVAVKSRSFIGGVGNEADRRVNSEAPCLHIVASNFFGGVNIRN